MTRSAGDANRATMLVWNGYTFMLFMQANYLLVNPTYGLLNGWKPVDGYKKILSARSYGQEILAIYEKDPG
jgi:hypothetical protein